jgi:hypothetical protein
MEPEIQNVDSSAFKYALKHYWLEALASLVLLGGTIIGSALNGVNNDRVYIYLSFALVTILGVIYSLAYQKALGEFMLEFGNKIGFNYSSSGDLSSVSGRVFRIGGSGRLSNVLSGTQDGYNTRIYNFQYMEGSGRDSHQVIQTVFEATLTTSVPDMLVLGPNIPWMNFTLTVDLAKLTLEGDFNKYFTVYAVKDSELEVYQVLTPDVMADMIDRATNFSFELNANKLYLFTLGDINTALEMKRMFDVATFLIDLLEKRTRGVSAASVTQPT